jgi:hypothetical protein
LVLSARLNGIDRELINLQAGAFMKSIIGTILLLTSVCFGTDNPKIQECLSEAASVSSDSGIEDQMRLACLQNNQQNITIGDCKQIKDRVNEKDTPTVVDICFNQLKTRVSINECFEVAGWNSKSESRDTASLSCLRENSSTISSVECFDHARRVFSESSTANLASFICADNLVSSPIASGVETSFSIDEQ